MFLKGSYLIFAFKTLKKEGHAFGNIGNKKYIFPTVKSALLLFYDMSPVTSPCLGQFGWSGCGVALSDVKRIFS